MKRHQAIAALMSEADAIRNLGVTALYLFGSVARDDAGDESDLDIFLDYDSSTGFSLLDLVGVKQLLEERLAVEVDVTTRNSLHPALRADIEKSAVRVF